MQLILKNLILQLCHSSLVLSNFDNLNLSQVSHLIQVYIFIVCECRLRSGFNSCLSPTAAQVTYGQSYNKYLNTKVLLIAENWLFKHICGSAL